MTETKSLKTISNVMLALTALFFAISIVVIQEQYSPPWHAYSTVLAISLAVPVLGAFIFGRDIKAALKENKLHKYVLLCVLGNFSFIMLLSAFPANTFTTFITVVGALVSFVSALLGYVVWSGAIKSPSSRSVV